MLRKWTFFFTVLILLSLITAPTGTARAHPEAATNDYEPDNSSGQARLITSGTPQTRSIVPKTDVDWIKLQLSVTSGVLLETAGTLFADTRISLYDGSLTPIEYNDDDGIDFFSYIDRLCAVDPLPAGTYFVKVEEFSNDAEIPTYHLAFDSSPCPAELVDIYTGGTRQGSSLLTLHAGTRRSLPAVNNGPVKIMNMGSSLMMASERVIYRVNGVNTSFSEIMAMPENQLDVSYWMPWYNNADLDTQLRIANVSSSTAAVHVYIGGAEMQGSPFNLTAGASVRKSYAGVNNGPVRIASSQRIVAAERVIYKANNVNTSFTEMMGLPAAKLDTTYWLPWYNNADLDTQLRIANITDTPTMVHVFIGGVEMQGSPFSLGPGVSTRKSFPGINNGPVKIVSDQLIVAAERVIYKVNNINTSFAEMMALPESELNSTYWLPWYNNADLDTQLRIANITDTPAMVHVFIGGVEMQGSPFSLGPGVSTRKSFPGINNGPVKIVSDQLIVAAERVIYKVNNINTSFAEMMALPESELNSTYWLPWYNNSGDLDTQLRIANVSPSTANVHIYIGGIEMIGSPFSLGSMASTRKSFPGVNNGPVKIVSDQPIVAAERLIYKANSIPTSFTEMMALPDDQLDLIHWLPWYNNVDLDSQLRFGLP